ACDRRGSQPVTGSPLGSLQTVSLARRLSSRCQVVRAAAGKDGHIYNQTRGTESSARGRQVGDERAKAGKRRQHSNAKFA
ncbi:hypothetical protein LIPSTDRAFT_71047, partial [Lipomyces starkeyi NRRL Y-11557]